MNMISNILNFIIYQTPIFYLIQSIWRDEAFSYFMARPNPVQIIINTANDFNPPLYYLLLHVWIQLVGKSDELLRILSFIPHLISVYIAYLLAKRIFSKNYAIFVGIFTFLNPMLIYYAFEMRMYSLYELFVFASLYFLYVKNWRRYTVACILGLYTHSFFPLVILSYTVYYFLLRKLNKKQLLLLIKPVLFYIPWIPVIITQFFHSKNSWLFPVDFKLIQSVLGNLFTNFEGTPGNDWLYTAFLSLFILFFLFIPFRRDRKKFLLFVTPILLPLGLIIGYSILKRPLYVNRYLISVSVFEIMAISLGIWNIKNKFLKSFCVISWILLIICINIYSPPYRKKTDFKTSFTDINSRIKDTDYIYSRTPIGFLESAYYAKNENKVFVYNPDNITIPNYIGVNVVFPDVSKVNLPPPPSTTYLIEDNAQYSIIINR